MICVREGYVAVFSGSNVGARVYFLPVLSFEGVDFLSVFESLFCGVYWELCGHQKIPCLQALFLKWS